MNALARLVMLIGDYPLANVRHVLVFRCSGCLLVVSARCEAFKTKRVSWERPGFSVHINCALRGCFMTAHTLNTRMRPARTGTGNRDGRVHPPHSQSTPGRLGQCAFIITGWGRTMIVMFACKCEVYSRFITH